MAPQILIFGLPRTGTQSILDALEILGYKKTYHMRNVEKEGNIEDWITLLDQKYDPSIDQKVDLQRLKGIVDGFDVSDALLTPQAKLILCKAGYGRLSIVHLRS